LVQWQKIMDYLLRFLSSKDITLIHLSLWTVSQLSAVPTLRAELKKSSTLGDRVAAAKQHEDTPEITKLAQEILTTVYLSDNQPEMT